MRFTHLKDLDIVVELDFNMGPLIGEVDESHLRGRDYNIEFSTLEPNN